VERGSFQANIIVTLPITVNERPHVSLSMIKIQKYIYH